MRPVWKSANEKQVGK